VSTPNAEQITHWNGEEARHWIDAQGRYDRQLEPFADAVLDAAALARTDRRLDLGCGCGRTTLLAAQRGATAVGVDISAPMLEQARADATAQHVENARFEQADVQSRTFAEGSFDVAISRFGVMFFDDPLAAFSNVAHALTPGGRLVFVCWQDLAHNEWLLVPGMAAAEHVALPDTGAADGPGMFSLADPDHVRALLAKAGFEGIDVAPFETRMLLAGGGTLDETIEFLLATGIARTMFENAAPDARARAVDAVRSALAGHYEGDGVRLGAATSWSPHTDRTDSS
jgi:SAM-dependent methyltransferase